MSFPFLEHTSNFFIDENSFGHNLFIDVASSFCFLLMILPIVPSILLFIDDSSSFFLWTQTTFSLMKSRFGHNLFIDAQHQVCCC